LLFDVSPNDPVRFVTVACLLAATALIAGGIPAWRAARIDPVSALRLSRAGRFEIAASFG